MTQLRAWIALRPWQRHGLVLLIAGCLFISIGFSFLTWLEDGPRYRALAIALHVAPITFWAYVFVAAGVLAVISSRWPPMNEKWGYAVLTGLSGGWAATYIIGYIFIPSHPEGNLTFGFMWAMIAFFLWAISGLSNPGSGPKEIVLIEVKPHGRES